jgi:DNA ligase-1
VTVIMEFHELAETLDKVSRTTKRTEKINIVSNFLRELEISEVRDAALFLSGRVFPENEELTLNISWNGVLSALHHVIDFQDSDLEKLYQGDAGEAIAALMQSNVYIQQSILFHEPLTIASVSKSFNKIARATGKGSTREKQASVSQLFAEATPREVRYLVALLLNDMRTGLAYGLLIEAVAEAYSIDVELVRRAWSFLGNLGETAEIAASQSDSGLRKVIIRPMIAVKPMLASPISDLKEALELAGGKVSFELKFDGARVQIHRQGNRVRIFSRGLNDMTESIPEIAAKALKNVKSKQVILDGEVVAVDDYGKPYPFQVVMKRFGRTKEIDAVRNRLKLDLYLFDILQLDGKMLVDETYAERRMKLEEIVPASMIVERVVTDKLDEAERFFQKSKKIGHEGLVAKLLDSPYVPGVRGRYWLKIKHTLNTMDLVIIAAERGHGRRSRWLSDYHLAVLDDEHNDYVMIGKTFKGLTDEEFEMMTEKLELLQISKQRGLVHVKPEVVVEVLASEIQESPKYASGLALRFARITRIRDDKSPDEVTTLRELKALYNAQFRYKAR